MINSLFENIQTVQARIAAACARSGRSPAEITLVAVTKTVSVETIRAAHALGISVIGENRVQEAWEKYLQLGDLAFTWHLIGHLQTNKVKRALQIASVIESVDSYRLAEEIDRAAAGRSTRTEMFLEVNTSGESNKYGATPEETIRLAQQLLTLPHLRLTGLMTVGIWTNDTVRIRAGFAALRQIRDQLQQLGVLLPHLSMGMSDDYEIAIEEGATLLRIGRALFGERK